MLFLKARATGNAGLHSDGSIIRTGFGEGAVAPAMGSVLDVGFVFGKCFVGQGRDVHFLRPNMAANVIWFHDTCCVLRVAYSVKDDAHEVNITVRYGNL